MKYLMVLLIFIVGCRNVPYTGDAGEGDQITIDCGDDSEYSRKVIRCLMTFITGGDSGGEWQTPIKPPSSTIDTRLIGPNPCIEWSDELCGNYQFYYIVGDDCCRDTAIVNINKCCLTGMSTCSF